MRIFSLALFALAATCTAQPIAAQTTGVRIMGRADNTTPDQRETPTNVVNGRIQVDTMSTATAVDRGAVVGTTAVQLMPANPVRRGIVVQVQSSTASCYLSAQATATLDYHSLLVNPMSYYESSPSHVGTGPLSVVCTAPGTSVYAREF